MALTSEGISTELELNELKNLKGQKYCPALLKNLKGQMYCSALLKNLEAEIEN